MFVNKSKKRSKALSIFIVFSILVSFFPVAVSFPTNVQAATTLNVYPAPSGVPLNTTYTVQVQVPGGAVAESGRLSNDGQRVHLKQYFLCLFRYGRPGEYLCHQ